MRKHVITLLALLTIGGAVSGYVLQAKDDLIGADWRTSEKPVTNREPCSGIFGGPYPSRVPRSVLLPAQDTHVRVGHDCYVDDIKVERQLEFRDGKKEVIGFRPDGTVFERTKYYATVNGDLGRVQSHATFAKDGVMFTSHQVYRGDGTLERSGEGERDGRYTTRYFFDDGVTVERLRNFSKTKEFVSEHIYRRDGSELAGISVTMDQLELGVTLYAPDGKKTATFYRTKVGEKGYVFADDGMTVMLEYAFDPYSRVAGYMDHDGRLVQKHDSRFNRLVIAFLSKDGSKTYTQIRRENDHVLRKVEERAFNGAELIRTIVMNKDGSRPEYVMYQEKSGRFVKVLDDNGNVVKIDHVDDEGKVIKSEPQSNPKPEAISPEVLAEPLPTAEKPTYKLSGPPLVYDYE